jgi:hypothetical protein
MLVLVGLRSHCRCPGKPTPMWPGLCSDRLFTGFVAEVWFSHLPSAFSTRWAAVIGYSILARSVSSGPGGAFRFPFPALFLVSRGF